MSDVRGKRPRRYADLSLEDRAEARRRDFLRAGVELIGTVGLQQTRIKDLCAEAGHTTRYFYESFTDLDQLAEEVVRQLVIDVGLRTITAALTAPSPELRVRAALEELVRAIAEKPTTGRILFIEPMRAGGRLAALRTEGLLAGANVGLAVIAGEDPTRIATVIEIWLKQFRAGDEVAADEPTSRDPRAVMAMGAFAELMVAWIEQRIDMSVREVVDHLSALMTALLPPAVAA